MLNRFLLRTEPCGGVPESRHEHHQQQYLGTWDALQCGRGRLGMLGVLGRVFW